MLTSEHLRVGTVELFRQIRSQGHRICIYTTSLRHPFKIYLLFRAHGLSLDGIFNKTAHDKKIRTLPVSCSKYPPMFGIDLHIDDSEGVGIEARKSGFKALIIREDDLHWTKTILDGIKTLLNPKNKRIFISVNATLLSPS